MSAFWFQASVLGQRKREAIVLAEDWGCTRKLNHCGDSRLLSHFSTGQEHSVSIETAVNGLAVITSLVLSLELSDGQDA